MSSTYLKDNLKGGYIAKGFETYKDGVLLLACNHPSLFGEKMRNVAMHRDDVYFTTYPRSGTHVGMELAQLVMNGGDTEALKKHHIHHRPGQLCITLAPEVLNGSVSSMETGPDPIELYTNTPSPRFFWAHGLYDFAPTDVKEGKCKVIVQVRNPKSTYVSWYHFMNGLAGIYLPEGGVSWDDWFAIIMANDNTILPFGTWFNLYIPWWEHRHNMDILFVQYEKLVQDASSLIKELGDFFGKTFTEDQVQRMSNHITFEEFKKNPAAGQAFKKFTLVNSDSAPHMRKGKVDDWKNMFTVAQSEAFDKLYEEKMAGTGFLKQIYE